jgi:hypothetical protein
LERNRRTAPDQRLDGSTVRWITRSPDPATAPTRSRSEPWRRSPERTRRRSSSNAGTPRSAYKPADSPDPGTPARTLPAQPGVPRDRSSCARRGTVGPLETQPIESRDLLPQDVRFTAPIVTNLVSDQNNPNVLREIKAYRRVQNLLYITNYKRLIKIPPHRRNSLSSSARVPARCRKFQQFDFLEPLQQFQSYCIPKPLRRSGFLPKRKPPCTMRARAIPTLKLL